VVLERGWDVHGWVVLCGGCGDGPLAAVASTSNSLDDCGCGLGSFWEEKVFFFVSCHIYYEEKRVGRVKYHESITNNIIIHRDTTRVEDVASDF